MEVQCLEQGIEPQRSVGKRRNLMHRTLVRPITPFPTMLDVAISLQSRLATVKRRFPPWACMGSLNDPAFQQTGVGWSGEEADIVNQQSRLRFAHDTKPTGCDLAIQSAFLLVLTRDCTLHGSSEMHMRPGSKAFALGHCYLEAIGTANWSSV